MVAEEREGRIVRYKHLTKIWELFRKPVALKKYIRDETAAFLKTPKEKKNGK